MYHNYKYAELFYTLSQNVFLNLSYDYNINHRV